MSAGRGDRGATSAALAPLRSASQLVADDGNPQDITLSGNLTGNGALTLDGDGAGELILSGTNTYNGRTNDEEGTLIVETAASLPTGSSLYVGQGASSISLAQLAGEPLAASPGAASAVPEPGMLAAFADGDLRRGGLVPLFETCDAEQGDSSDNGTVNRCCLQVPFEVMDDLAFRGDRQSREQGIA